MTTITSDPLSDMLIRIKNALAVKKAEVVLPYSKIKHNLANLLEKQGLIESLEVMTPAVKSGISGSGRNYKSLKLKLKYSEGNQPAISGLKRVSKPGQRIYAKASNIQEFRLGIGITVISTSKGLMTSQEARKEKIGGEVICQIW